MSEDEIRKAWERVLKRTRITPTKVTMLKTPYGVTYLREIK